MAIFSRRRIQAMLNDLTPVLADDKRLDLVRRLGSMRVDQAPAAELELAFLWSSMQFGEIEIEPSWWLSEHRPEVFIREMYPLQPAVIEVAAVCDGSMSADEAMRRCSISIADFCNTVRKGITQNLYFQFSELNDISDGVFVREVAAPKNFVLSPQAKEVLKNWVLTQASEPPPLRLRDRGLDVMITREKYKILPHNSFWTSRPPVAYSLTSNPIYDALTNKMHQVEHAPEGTLRIIVLAEAGSRVLEWLWSSMRAGRYSAEEIIRRFMNDKRGRVDAVLVVSPRPGRVITGNEVEAVWHSCLFSEVADLRFGDAIDAIVSRLPPARLTGANARTQLRDRHARPNLLPFYRNPKISRKRRENPELKYSISSRALLDFLSGKISEERFRASIGDTEGGLQFKIFLKEGMTIQAAHIESGAPDHDDDRIVFELGADPAVRPFE